jgi:CheY-like chemotaxis protein
MDHRSRTPIAPRKVLVCDDEPVVRMLVHATLGRVNCSMIVARDGHEALALARSEQPALIVLDVVLPGRSGRDVLAGLRGDPTTAAIPIIILTAWAPAEGRQELLGAGADGYLTKPFSPLALASLVEELLEHPLPASRAA